MKEKDVIEVLRSACNTIRLNHFRFVESGLFIMGGSIAEIMRGTEAKMHSVFLRNKETAMSLSNAYGADPLIEQNIKVFTSVHREPEELAKTFGFVHETCWYDPSENRLHTPPSALESILSGYLVYQTTGNPNESAVEASRLLQKGWKISAPQLLKIALMISKENHND